MAFRLDHRISYDADIFLHDPQILAYLSPRTNEIAQALARDYQESANGLKLVTAHGDIDFIVGRDLTATPSIIELIDGKNVTSHSNTEILAKKIEFRGSYFTLRDMFDLTVLIDRDPMSVERALFACSRAAKSNVKRRIAEEIEGLANALPDFVNPTTSGARYIEAAPALLRERFKL